MEIWDAYDRDLNKLGYDLVRGQQLDEGVYHLVCKSVIRHTDGEYLLMLRAPQKKSFPNCWEAGAGGCAMKGEDILTAMRREIFEETGITGGKLSPLYRLVREQSHIIFCGHLLITDCDKNGIVLQEGETVAYRWVTKEEFIRWFDEENEIPSVKVRLKDFIDSLR